MKFHLHPMSVQCEKCHLEGPGAELRLLNSHDVNYFLCNNCLEDLMMELNDLLEERGCDG